MHAQGQKYYTVEFKYDLLTGAGFTVERVGYGSITQASHLNLKNTFQFIYKVILLVEHTSTITFLVIIVVAILKQGRVCTPRIDSYD
jgi:hypothetical protein